MVLTVISFIVRGGCVEQDQDQERAKAGKALVPTHPTRTRGVSVVHRNPLPFALLKRVAWVHFYV